MEKLCALTSAIGNVEECPRGWCSFWEGGGAVVEPGCTIERLGVDLSNVDLAYHLLELRRALDASRNAAEAEIATHQLRALVPPDLSGA
jgi:hypothetical protein